MLATHCQPITRGVPGSGTVSISDSFSSKTVRPPATGPGSSSAGSEPTGTQTCVSLPLAWTMIGPVGAARRMTCPSLPISPVSSSREPASRATRLPRAGAHVADAARNQAGGGDLRAGLALHLGDPVGAAEEDDRLPLRHHDLEDAGQAGLDLRDARRRTAFTELAEEGGQVEDRYGPAVGQSYEQPVGVLVVRQAGHRPADRPARHDRPRRGLARGERLAPRRGGGDRVGAA